VVCVLQAIDDGYRYGFDVIDQTRVPSGPECAALNLLERLTRAERIPAKDRREADQAARGY